MQGVCRSRSHASLTFACAAMVLAVAIAQGSLPAVGVIVLGIGLAALGKERTP